MRVLTRLWLAATLATAFPGAMPAQTYPGVPVLTTAGPLSCGLRMYSAGMAQTYCLYNAPPAPVVTVCNSLGAISPKASGGLPYGLVLSCNAADLPNSLFYSVTWMVTPVSDGTVQYQVFWFAVPCQPPITATSNLVGGCVSAGAVNPGFQQGSIQ